MGGVSRATGSLRLREGQAVERPWRRRLVLWAPLLLYLALIFGLSALSHPLGPVNLGGLDKLAHASEYAVLGALVLRLLHGVRPGGSLRAAVIGAVLLSVLWGASDELHQAFVPLRDPSLLDLAADTTGAIAGSLAWAILVIRRGLLSGPPRR